MRSRRARRQTRAGLWLVERGLALLGRDPAAIGGLAHTASGRPTLPGVTFNISHSRSLVACALATEHALGLDVEYRARPRPRYLPRVLGAAELAAVTQQPSRFFDFWSAREACVKATGRVGLARIAAVELADDCALIDGCCWRLTALSLGADFAAVLATDRVVDSLAIRALSLA